MVSRSGFKNDKRGSFIFKYDGIAPDEVLPADCDKRDDLAFSLWHRMKLKGIVRRVVNEFRDVVRIVKPHSVQREFQGLNLRAFPEMKEGFLVLNE